MGAAPSTDLIPVGPPIRAGMSSIELAPAAWQLAHRVAGTEFVPTALRGKPEAVLACILAGHEAGITPMQALQKIHVIEGRPALSAELMRGLVLQHGHEIWFEEQSSTRVTIGGKRAGGTRETKITWTMDDAKRAGLADRANWKKYPRAMLAARATSELCRAVFPDVLAGLSHTVEELTDGDIVADVDLGPPEVVTASTTPPGRKVQASRDATAGATAAASAPDTAPPPTAAPVPPLPGEDEPGDDDADTVVEPDSDDPAPTSDDSDIIDAEVVTDDAEQVDMFPPDPEPPVDTGPRYSGAQLVAIRLTEAGYTTRQEALDMCTALTGRTITSRNDLTPDEIRMILEAFDEEALKKAAPEGTLPDVDVPEGEAETHAEPVPAGSEAGAERSVPAPSGRRPRPEPSFEGYTGDQWRDLLKRRGVKAGELLKHARTLVEGPVATLDDIAGLGIGQDLADWIEDRSLTR